MVINPDTLFVTASLFGGPPYIYLVLRWWSGAIFHSYFQYKLWYEDQKKTQKKEAA